MDASWRPWPDRKALLITAHSHLERVPGRCWTVAVVLLLSLLRDTDGLNAIGIDPSAVILERGRQRTPPSRSSKAARALPWLPEPWMG